MSKSKEIFERRKKLLPNAVGIFNPSTATSAQAKKLIHSSFNVACYEIYLDLAQRLVDILPHGEATKVMLTNSELESIENAGGKTSYSKTSYYLL